MIRDAGEALDHLLIGAPTLEEGIAWLREKTGVQAAVGGSHPGLGTWNALASLGPRQYIEIIAPDPAQPGVPTFYAPSLRDLKTPRVAAWAAAATSLASRFGTNLPPGFVCETPRSGSRVRPDGTRLAWTLAFPRLIARGTLGGVLPFFIDWAATEHHPGQTSSPGLTLRGFAIEHPEPGDVLDGLRALGLDAPVHEAVNARIRVEVLGPSGSIVL